MNFKNEEYFKAFHGMIILITVLTMVWRIDTNLLFCRLIPLGESDQP